MIEYVFNLLLTSCYLSCGLLSIFNVADGFYRHVTTFNLLVVAKAKPSKFFKLRLKFCLFVFLQMVSLSACALGIREVWG